MAALKLLVVEDCADARDGLCEMIRILGHAASGAANAEEGMALLENFRFDALFVDINLPGMSGIEMAQRAVRTDPGVKIVFASGFGFLVSDKTDFDFTLLPKPWSFDQLKYALEQVSCTVVDSQ